MDVRTSMFHQPARKAAGNPNVIRWLSQAEWRRLQQLHRVCVCVLYLYLQECVCRLIPVHTHSSASCMYPLLNPSYRPVHAGAELLVGAVGCGRQEGLGGAEVLEAWTGDGFPKNNGHNENYNQDHSYSYGHGSASRAANRTSEQSPTMSFKCSITPRHSDTDSLNMRLSFGCDLNIWWRTTGASWHTQTVWSSLDDPLLTGGVSGTPSMEADD